MACGAPDEHVEMVHFVEQFYVADEILDRDFESTYAGSAGPSQRDARTGDVEGGRVRVDEHARPAQNPDANHVVDQLPVRRDERRAEVADLQRVQQRDVTPDPSQIRVDDAPARLEPVAGHSRE